MNAQHNKHMLICPCLKYYYCHFYYHYDHQQHRQILCFSRQLLTCHHNSHRRCFRWIAEQNDITFIADIYISHTAAGSTHHISAQHGHKYTTWQMPLHHVAKAEDGLRATINGVRWVGSSSGRNIGGWLAVAVDADADWLVKMLLRNWQWIVGTISTEHLTAAPNTHTHKHTDHLHRQYSHHC